jgi:dUTP pyrophosphatase
MSEALVEVVRLPHADGLALPGYASAGAAAMDLLAAVAEPLVLPPGGRAAIPTGLMVALPAGHELQIRPRSGLALNQGILVANAPGTVDEDYRGEIKVILMNGGSEPVVVTRGMRIAQAVLAPVTRIVWREVAELDETVRGAGGFGSTGV